MNSIRITMKWPKGINPVHWDTKLAMAFEPNTIRIGTWTKGATGAIRAEHHHKLAAGIITHEFLHLLLNELEGKDASLRLDNMPSFWLTRYLPPINGLFGNNIGKAMPVRMKRWRAHTRA